MNCSYCKNTLEKSTTTHCVDLKKCIIVIKNVPCLECKKCGEIFFTDEVEEKLENIVMSMSNIMTEIAVIDFSENTAA